MTTWRSGWSFQMRVMSRRRPSRRHPHIDKRQGIRLAGGGAGLHLVRPSSPWNAESISTRSGGLRGVVADSSAFVSFSALFLRAPRPRILRMSSWIADCRDHEDAVVGLPAGRIHRSFSLGVGEGQFEHEGGPAAGDRRSRRTGCRRVPWRRSPRCAGRTRGRCGGW